MKNKNIDAITGKETFVDFTQEELDHIEQSKVRLEAKLAAQAEIEATKNAAQAKLAALGLTADDLKALGLG